MSTYAVFIPKTSPKQSTVAVKVRRFSTVEISYLHSKYPMFINLQVLRAVLMVLCAVALAFVTWRFILPLIAMHVAGVGVAIPLPKGFVQAYPKLAVWIFVVGGPLLFFAMVVAIIWLLRLRLMPR
jgi:hypothetical protein